VFLFVNVVPTLVAAGLVYLFAPESPRFYMARGRLKEAVQVANFIARRMGYYGDDGENNNFLTEEELRKYIFHSKRIGLMSFRGKEMIMHNEEYDSELDGGSGGEGGDDLLQEVWMSLSTIKQVFVNGHWKTTVPLQLSYLTLTLITGEDLIRIYTSVNIVSNTKSFRHEKGVATWWTRMFQNLELQTDAFALSFYHTLSQIPGVILASGLIDSVGRRKLVIIGFGCGAAVLTMLSVTTHFIHKSHLHDDAVLGIIHESKGYYTWIVLGLANLFTICLCMGWLAIDCLTAESFPTKVRSTGRGVCVASGRMAGFSVQFLYGPLVNQNRLSLMMGIASVFAVGGMLVSCQTTDTTNDDLQDHWGSENGSEATNNSVVPFAEAKRRGKYLSIEQTPHDSMSPRSR